MKHKVMLLMWLLIWGLIAPQWAPAEAQESRVLPPAGFFSGWTLEEPVKVYTADNLFEYINGEAELVFQYGFKDLISGFYLREKDEKQGISADVYRMGSPLEAYGLYARYRGTGAKIVEVGLEGFISPSQLMFCQGRFLVQLNASGTANLEPAVFLSLARTISGNIPDRAEPVRELELLKIDGFISGSERYIPSGVLGYAFFQKGILGQILLKGKPVRAFVLLGESPEGARRAVQAYEKALQEKGIPVNKAGGPQETILTARDPLYGGLCLQAWGNDVLGVADLPDFGSGINLIRQLRKRVP